MSPAPGGSRCSPSWACRFRRARTSRCPGRRALERARCCRCPGSLDEESALMVAVLLETLPAEHDCTLVLVTHNRALSARAPLQYRLVDGRLGSAAGLVA